MKDLHNGEDAGSGILAWHEGEALTDNRERIARNLDCDESVIERMREGGMDRDAFYRIVPAELAEAHMAEKYGIGFEAVDAYLNGTDAENACMVTVSPLEGEHKRGEYLVRCAWVAGGDPVWTEEYFEDFMSPAYDAYLREALRPAVEAGPHRVAVGAELDSFGLYGDDMNPRTPVEDVAASCEGTLYVFFADEESLTREAYDAELARIRDAAEATGAPLVLESACLTGVGPDELSAGAGKAALRSTANLQEPRYRWHERAYLNKA